MRMEIKNVPSFSGHFYCNGLQEYGLHINPEPFVSNNYFVFLIFILINSTANENAIAKYK